MSLPLGHRPQAEGLDHRQLAGEMEIYVLNEEIGAGLPLWLPRGAAMRDALEAFIKRLEHEADYQRVISPHLAKASLYEASGHLKHYRADMFPPIQDGGDQFYLKPMNCPHHHQIFQASPRSYRDLPVRLAECGQVYRNENSGSLKGLSRVRGLCQNDAHIYVAEKQIASELDSVLDMFEKCYRALGLPKVRYRLSLGDPARADFEGDLKDWAKAEDFLRQALKQRGLEFFEAPGEAAFYGPKIDVQVAIAGGAEESVASLQLDFLSAGRFDLAFIDENGERQRPWILHRAPLGSFERMVALLLEVHQGRLPGWLQPIQVYLLPVDEKHQFFAQVLAKQLRAQGVRAEIDVRQGRLGKRIHFAHGLRPALMIVLGDREVDGGNFKVQSRDSVLEVAPEQLFEVVARKMKGPLVS